MKIFNTLHVCHYQKYLFVTYVSVIAHLFDNIANSKLDYI
jgi:hypothetical protein